MKPFAKLLSILFIGVLLVGPSVPRAYADDTGNPVVSSVEDTSSSTPPTESSSVETPIPNDGSSATSTEDVVEKDEATSTNEIVEEDAVANSFSARSASLMTADSATIDLEIETASSTLYDGPLTVTACPDARNSVNETINGFCAIEQSGLPVTWTWFTFGGESAFLDTIEGIGNGNGSTNYWTWFADGDVGMTGLNQHELHDGEKLVVTIDRMPMRIAVADPSFDISTSTTVTVEGFNAFNFDYEPLEGATILGTSGVLTGADGHATITATSTATFSIRASKTGYLDSDAVSITPTQSVATLPSIPITLQVYTATTTLFSGPRTVTACPDTQSGSSLTVNGYCALMQSGLPVTWTWFTFGGESAFLDTIRGVGNGHGSDTYWTWFSGTDAGMTGLNQHVLTANEHLVVAIDRMPLRISVATSTPVVGSSTTITVEGFNAFNFDYEPVAGAVIVGASAPNTDERGVTGFTATSTDTLTISATAPGFLTSNTLTITPIAESVSTTTSGGGASGGSGNSGDSNFNTSAAFTYLVSRQHSNGSFGADGYSDWAAFAFMLPDAPSGARAALITYQKTASPSLTVVNDYERHALALEALGINPSTGTSRNYIAPIVAAFDGTQIGRASDVNDDMFGLLALLYAGYSTNDPMIQKIVSFIVRQQHGDGSWLGGVDIAAAGIQSLEPVSSLPGVTGAIAKARTYLKNQQQSDGGFGNPDATSWTLQAVSALRETPTSWTIGTSTPLTYLTTMQQVDGSINSGQEDASAALWSTEYALPGAEGRTWASLLNSFTLPTGTTDSGSTAGSTTTPTLATTTIPVPTSSTTPAIVPSDIISSTTVSTDPLSTDLRKDAASKGYVLGTTTSVENSDQVHSETGAATTMPTPLSVSFAHAVEHFFATVFLGLKEFFMHLFGKYGP